MEDIEKRSDEEELELGGQRNALGIRGSGVLFEGRAVARRTAQRALDKRIGCVFKGRAGARRTAQRARDRRVGRALRQRTRYK